LTETPEKPVIEAKESQNASEEGSPPPRNRGGTLLKPWKPGQSGNPKGRPRIEPRVRRYARTYDRAMCRVLASIAQDEKAPVSERRKAAMDLIAVGSGRPELVQQITGRDGAPIGPLVNLNFGGGMQHGHLSPQDAYRAMVEGVIELDPAHPSFKPAIEQQPSDAAKKIEDEA
jgi:hypothetical protein